MPWGLGLLGVLLGCQLLAGGSARSPRSLWKQEEKRRSVPELGPWVGWGRGTGGLGRPFRVCFSAPWVVFPSWTVSNLSHHFLPLEGKPREILPCGAGVGPGTVTGAASAPSLACEGPPWRAP